MIWKLKKITQVFDALRQMPQNPVTIKAQLDVDDVQSLLGVLARIQEDTFRNDILPFGAFDEALHFARIFTLEGIDAPNATQQNLLFMANVDVSDLAFLEMLIDRAASGIDAVFGYCQDYPDKPQRTDETRLEFLKSHLIPAQAYYVNTLGRSVKQILQEDALRQAIQGFLAGVDPTTYGSADQIRRAVVKHVLSLPHLSFAHEPRQKQPLLWRVKEHCRFIGLVVLGVILVLWLWPVLLGVVLALQWKEHRDIPDTQRPRLSTLNQLRSREDFNAHNQFSAAGYLKPGLLRRYTVRGVLFIANVALRHVFNRGDLAGVPLLGLEGVDTIHFARWVMIDDDRRLVFASNYDGSLESYMVDFVDKVAWGLNLVFSNGLGYPFTRWLVLDGAKDEERFKDFIGNHQLVTQVWHAPYGHLTAVNIANNEKIRDGLYGPMSESQAQQWLQRL